MGNRYVSPTPATLFDDPVGTAADGYMAANITITKDGSAVQPVAPEPMVAAGREEPTTKQGTRIVTEYAGDVRHAVLESLNGLDRTFITMRDSSFLRQLFTIWLQNAERKKVEPRLEYFVSFIRINLNHLRLYVKNQMRGTLSDWMKNENREEKPKRRPRGKSYQESRTA